MFVNDALPYYWLALVLVDMLKPGVAACASAALSSPSQTQTPAYSPPSHPDQEMMSENLGFQNDLSAFEALNGLMYNINHGQTMGGARIVDLEEQNDKFADVDFREMLTIAKDFARGDTGTMRAPSLAPMN